MDRSTLGARPKWLIALGVVALGVYVWIAAGLRPFTLGEEIMVAIPALIVFVGAWRPTRSKGTVDASRASIAVWLLVVAVAVSWELYAYFSSPRHAHPTLSVIADDIMSVHAGRALLFLGWLALGWLLISRREPASQ